MHKRIVSLLPSFTKIICELLYRESLIEISHECYCPISISGIPVFSTIYLYSKDARIFVLTSKAYLYAIIAGISIGIAEIGYFVLFNPTNPNGALNANVAIPVVLGGTILITMFLSFNYFKETYNFHKIIGAIFIIIGIYLILIKKTTN